MFIRWVVRKHKNATVADMIFHDAYLIESYRDDQNSPRHRTICYLGNIRQIGDSFPTIERELFFLRAERILASMPEVDGEERARVLEMLRDKVPPLSPDEVIEAFRNNMRWSVRWWREHGRAPTREELLAMFDDANEELGPV